MFVDRAYGNAVEDDLWQALQEQATIDRVNLPAPIKTIMDSWCDKMGFPLITVKRNYATGGAQISQVHSKDVCSIILSKFLNLI